MAIVKKNLRSAYPLLGRFRKGAPKPESGNKPGADLEYFRVEFEPQFSFLQPDFLAMYGDKPTKIDSIILLGKLTDDVFPTSYKQHNTRRDVIRECDGDFQTRYLGGDFKYHRDPLPCLANGNKAPCELCKQEGILFFGIPDFIYQTGIRGYFMMTTHAWNDIDSIFNTIDSAYDDVGMLNGLTFTLERVTSKVNHGKQTKQSDGSYAITGRMSSDKSLVKLTPTAETTRKFLLPAMTSPVVLAIPEITSPVDNGYMLESGQDDGESMPQIDWFQELSNWANKNLNLQESEVLEALENHVNIIENAGGYYSSAEKSDAYAIVITAYNGYDLQHILNWFNDKLPNQKDKLFPICETYCKGE